MRLNTEATTLQSGSSIPLFGDVDFMSEIEADTALPGFINQGGAVLVNVSVIKAYQQIIRRLEVQVLHYRALLNQLRPRPEANEDVDRLSTPLNEVSVQTLNSILQARPSENVLRAFDEEEI